MKVKLTDMLGDSEAALELRARVLELTLQNHREVNVLVGDVTPRDLDLFFGPIKPGEVFIVVGPGVTWGTVLAAVGGFKSRTDAKRMGRDGPIADGFDMFTVGRKNRRVCASLRIVE